MATMGYTTEPTDIVVGLQLAKDDWEIQRITASGNGSLTDIYWYYMNPAQDGGNATVTAGIYSDDGTVEYDSKSIDTGIGVVQAWHQFTLDSPVTIISGVDYRFTLTHTYDNANNGAYNIDPALDKNSIIDDENSIDRNAVTDAYIENDNLGVYGVYTPAAEGGPSYLMNGITPGKVEGIDYTDLADIT